MPGVVVDTSVWIEYLDATESRADARLTEAITNRFTLVIPEGVLMELLTGSTSDRAADARERFLLRFNVEPLAPIEDSLRAAAIQRACRRGGQTVRNLVDCMIAATALRLDLPVMHCDRDFEVIAQATGLRTEPLLG